MVKSENGVVEIDGSISEYCADLAMLIRKINASITEEKCDEIALNMIIKSVELGIKSENQILNEYKSLLNRKTQVKKSNNEQAGFFAKLFHRTNK